MKINKVVVGTPSENCYLLEKDNHILIIDPGAEYLKIKKEIGNKIVDGVLITHKHFDHIGALDQIVNIMKVEYYCKDNLSEGINKVGKFTFKVIFTPGHSKDSISFYFEEINSIFCGDFIFLRNIGRWDLESGNELEMVQSLEKIKQYNDDIRLYPGHGLETVLGYEKIYNPYLK